MTIHSMTARGRAARGAAIALVVLALAGCSGQVSDLDKAQARVDSAQKAVNEAEAAFSDASSAFCDASATYISALDRYGDVLNDTAPTVGDVRVAGADLARPQENALEGADAAVQAHDDLVAAQQDLVDAQTDLEQVKAGATGTPSPVAAPPSQTPLAPAASVDRVTQAEDEFEAAQGAITDETPLAEASESFHSAAVALEFAWLRLFIDTGCSTDEQTQQAQAAVSAFVTALQQDLTTAEYYTGAIDGVYGPQTVAAVEALQTAHGLPVTGTIDQATFEALQADVVAKGGADAKEELASTAALQQTLKLVGFWDGPVDGVPTPELTDALKAFQVELGVEPTGVVDAATVAAFQAALAALTAPEPSPTPSPSSTDG